MATLGTATHPDCEFQHAIDNQNKLGWFPMIMGYISLHWRGVQQAYYVSLGRRNTGKQWAIQLIIQFFNVSWDMWEHRNGITHDPNSPAQRRRAFALNARIQSEYRLGSQRLLPRDPRGFHKPLSHVLGYDLQDNEQWLSSVHFARICWSHRRDAARAAMDASRRALRNWLIPAPTQPVIP